MREATKPKPSDLVETEAKPSEQALHEIERRFRALVSASADVVFRMSADWSTMRQLQAQDFLASTAADNSSWIEEYVPATDQAAVRSAVEEATRANSIFELEHRVYRADGSVGWIHSRAAPLFDERGQVIEWYGFASDITDRVAFEKQARRDLESTLLLLNAADSLNTWTNLEELLEGLARVTHRVTDHTRATVALWDEERRLLEIRASVGVQPLPSGRISDDELLVGWQPALASARSRVIDFDTKTTRPKSLYPEHDARLALVVPVRYQDHVVAVLRVDDPAERRQFSDREVALVEGVAAHAAVALENARLFTLSREQSRLGASMAEINAQLSSSLSVAVTLPTVLERVRRDVRAHVVAVADRVEGGWRIRGLSGNAGSELVPGFVFSDAEAPTMVRLMNQEHGEVVADVELSDEANKTVAERAGYRAYVAEPLVARGRVFGAIGIFFSQPHRPTDPEVDYFRRVAFAISLAEENSRLYEADHQIAETLQAAMLALPERIEGVGFAHLYRSASETARVGGDFYDLFELGHNRVGITVGDIAGHGIEAAVLTSLVKNAIRVQATVEDRRPNEIMAAASELMFANSPPEVFATVFFGVLDLDTGLLEYCNAGHTTGACICRDGTVSRLPADSAIMGAFPHQHFQLSTDHLDVGCLLFLYTDGLTEARRNGELYGEARLFETLSREQGRDAETTMRTVFDEVLAFSGEELADDVAILALQYVGLAQGESGPDATGSPV